MNLKFLRIAGAGGRADDGVSAGWMRLGRADEPPAESVARLQKCGAFAASVRRFVAPDVQMLDGERSIMRGHLLVVLPARSGSVALSARAFEHLRLFLEDFSLGLGHGSHSRLSDQTGEVEDRGAEHGPD